jgi:putative membrane protein
MQINAESPKVARNAKRPPSHNICNTAFAALGMTLLALGLLVPCAKAQTTVTAADAKFLLAAAQGGMTEVKLGEVAASQGVSEEVKNFGRKMVKDHSAINDDLKSLAAKKGVTLPDALDAKHQGTLDKLTALTGSSFDDAYIAAMIKGHKQTAKAFKAEAAATQDADIKGFLDKSVPVVEEHLKLITDMKKS